MKVKVKITIYGIYSKSSHFPVTHVWCKLFNGRCLATFGQISAEKSYGLLYIYLHVLS